MRFAFVVFAVLLVPAVAPATVLGTYPQFERSFEVFGDREVTGNTLMVYNNNVNKALMQGGSLGTVVGVPVGATVEAAYLFWTGTYDENPDRSVDFQLSDGRVINDLHVNQAQPGEDPGLVQGQDCVTHRRNTVYNNGQINFDIDFFYCRRDITFLLNSLGANINGDYRVSDVQALPGWPQDGRAYQAHPQWKCANSNRIEQRLRYGCQAMYAGWSMVVVWSHPDQRVRRNITLNDGFLLLDDDQASAGITEVTMRNFQVPEGATGEFSFFGLEGDPDYGSNQAQLPPGSQCINCPDFVTMRTSGNAQETQLSAEPGNSAGNLWNGSIMTVGGGVSPGVDIDVYDVGSGGLGILREGDRTATFRLGTGDGVRGRTVTNNPRTIEGEGELVLLGWTALSLDVVSPNLNNAATRKAVSRSSAGPGDLIQYQVTVTNDGSAPASDVTLIDVMPQGTAYVAGSTSTSCGVAAPDVNGDSPLLSGLNLGALPDQPVSRASCTVTFNVRVNDDAEAGSIIRNSAQIRSAEQAEFSTNQVQTEIIGPNMGTPQLTVSDRNGGSFEIGDNVDYRLLVRNIGSTGAAGLTLSATWPPQLATPSVFGASSSYDVQSRTLTITGVSVDALDDQQIFIQGQVQGADPAQVSLQFFMSANFLEQPMASDDPAVPGPIDPTVFGVVDGPNLSNSAKFGEDVNGAPLVPGDQLRYTITLRNSGNREGSLSVSDLLQAPLTGCTVQSFDVGLMNAECNGQTLSISGRLPAGETRTVVFLTTIGAALDGTLVSNEATLNVLGEASSALTAPNMVVARGPILVDSSLEAEDLNGAPLTPGDIVELRFVARNSGGAALRNLVVSSVLDPRLSIEQNNDGGTLQGATIRWQSDAELAAGESRTFTLRVRISSGLASGTRIAVNAGFIGDTLQVFQAEPVVLIIDALPVLTLTKAVAPADDGQYNPGELLRYTLTLTNTSTVLAEQLLVRDALPEGLVQGVASQGGQVVDGVALWNAQSTPALQGLGAGESLQLELTARITAPMEDRRELLNQARLSAAGAEAIDSDDPATPGIVGDPTSITVRSQTNLVVEKSQTALGERPYEPGTQVTYRLRVAAGGTQRARGLVLADTLPEGISYVSSSPAALVNGSNISWSATQAPGLGNLAPSTEVILNVVVQIDDRALAGTIISNQARVRGDTHNGDLLSNDPDTVAVDDETSFLVGGTPNLSVIKTVEESLADNFWRIGERVRYRIVIRNNGSVDVANLSILDLIDPNLSEVVIDGDWGSFADGRISGAVARLNHGSDITLSFTARLAAAPNGTLVVNQASVSVAGSNANILSDDPSSPGDADPTVLTLSAEEGLSLLKTVEDLNGNSVLPGDRLRYSITLTNTGETPSGAVSFSDTFDQRLQIIGVEAGLQNSIVEQSVTWSVGGLDSGESVTAHVIAQVVDGLVQGSTIDNQAEMSFEGETLFSDDGEVGNDDPTPTRVVIGEIPVPQPVMSKSVEPSAVARGETATWTITLRNEGSGALDNAQWTDVLPEGLEIIDVEGATALGNNLSASLDLGPGEEAEIVVSTRVLPSAGELISNQASLIFEGEELLSDDPNTAQQGDSTELRIMPAALDPLLEKTVTDLNGDPLEPGDEVEYLIILRNRGSEALPSFVLSDELDENLRFVEDSLVIQDVVVPGANMLAQGLALDAGLQPGESISLRFRAQVVDDAEQGQLITNQAQLIDGQSQRWLSDDPNLPGGPQPTLLQVGSSGAIAAYKTVSPERALRGDEVIWQIELLSAANGARSLRLSDVLPEGLSYVENSVTLDGLPLSDAVDDDEASVDPGLGRLDLILDLGPERPRAVLQFRSLVEASNRSVINQALLDVNGQTLLSDGDPSTPGLQGTTLVLLADGATLSGEKVAADLNGGTVQPGDEIRYTLRLRNEGDEDIIIPAGALDDPLQQMSYVEGSAEPALLELADGTLRNTAALNLAAGAQLSLSFTAVLSADLQQAQSVTNSFYVREPVEFNAESVLEIGASAPGATVSGAVFVNGASERKLHNWLVRIANSRDLSERVEMRTDEEGAFSFTGLTWPTVQIEVLNDQTTSFYKAQINDLSDGAQIEHPCAIDPSGVIYDTVSGAPIAGALVSILYDVSGDPVLQDDLPEGQQGQITGVDGFYQFDVKPPHTYRLSVTPPGAFHSFPSQELRPVGATLARRFGRPSRMSQNPDRVDFYVPTDAEGAEMAGRAVVPEPIPVAEQRMPYFLRFDIQNVDDAVFHNHVPLDPLRKQVRLTRRSSKNEASAGDLVTFTVEVDNRSSQTLGDQLDGGVDLLDLLPPGLLLMRDKNDEPLEAFEVFDAQNRRAVLGNLRSIGQGFLRKVQGLSLAPGSRLLWHYRVKVSGSLGAGVLHSSNQLLTRIGRMPVAETAEHRLILRQDPVLREATLIGRAYCDRNGDSHPGAGEEGVPGLRIYADHGVRVDTDAYGRFHFSRLSPGLRRFKLDQRSLPPGIKLIGLAGQNRLITPAVPVTLDFPLNCPADLTLAEQVSANQNAEGVEAPPPPSPPRAVSLKADLVGQQISADGVTLHGPNVQATATLVGQDPAYDLAQGPNLDPMASSVELHARVSGPLPLSRWRWRVVNTAGQQVFTQDGKGAAPELYVWQIPAELKRDARYEALLSVTDVGGDTAWSRPIPIGLGLGLPGADKRKRRTRINSVNGRLFVDDGATPTPRLRGWFNDRIARLRGEQDLMVEIFVYGAPKRKAKVKNALAWTQRRARTLEGILLASGVERERFVVQAMGNLRKLAPERNEKIARLNRRIELRFRLRAKEHPPLSPEVQPVANLIVNGGAVVLNKQGVGEAKVKVPVGHFLRVDAVFASGARSVLRRLRHPDGLSTRAVVLQGSGVVVSGKLRGERSLRVGDQDVDLSALSVRLRPMMVAVPLDSNGNGLAGVGEEVSKTACLGMCFGTSSDMVMQGWELRLFAEASDKPRANSNDKATLRRKIHTITGVGPVPPVLNWDGKNAQGAFILRQGVYSARLIARGKGGLVGLSRPIHFRAYRPQEDFRVLLADPFGSLKRKSKLPAMKLSADGKRDFERFMKLAARVSGSIEITGHVDVRLRASQALVMSRSMAESLRDAMVAKGIDAGRIMLRGEGSSNRLIMRAKNQADHAKNRRVELLLRSDELPELPALRNASARLHSPNGDLLAQRDGTLQGELFPDASGKIMVQVLDGSGRAAQVPLNLEAQTKLEEMELVLVLPALTADGAAMIETDATSLRVQLPAEGAVLSSANLGIFGSVLAGVRVRINGKSVQVHPLSGRFGAALTLAEGEQELLVEAEDAQGHRARVQRKVRVVPSGRFLMAIADLGYQTVAAQLPGLRADRSYDIGAYGRVGGRAMVWFKERWDLGDSSFFKKLELNAYLDTDRVYGEFKEFSRDDLSLRLLPPEFGDEAKEVQEIQAAGPIFLDLKADDSRFRFANFKTALPGRELLKYSRSFYGLDLLFDRKFGDVKKPERVQAQLYLSDTAAGLRSASNLLRGTGSSFYRLRHRDLLPGSDQVRLVVRDAANGLLLFERNMQRGVDYRIDAVEGLLILTQPLASTAGTQMASAYGVSTADLGGHPVFLHVAYTHRDDERLASFAAGGRVDGASKKLGVKGGVSYAFEGRADGGSAFQAAGAFAKYAHKDGHTAKAEFAWSRAIDGDHYASADGGNSYQRMGEDPAQAAVDFNGRLYPTQLNPAGAPRTGIAWSLGGKMLAGKWLKRAKKDDAIVETYLRQTTPGFYGGGASLDQGQTRWGLLSSYRLDPRDRASLRYDASYSLVSAPLSLGEFSLPEPAVREYRSIHREALTLRFERKEKRWTAGAQYQLGYTGDSWNYVDAPEGTRADVLSNVIAADGLYRIDKRWSAGGAQKAIISGDDLRFEDPFARFLTTARARFAVDKKLAVELEEELRWNGDNQTRLSLVRRPHPGMEQYVQERLTNQNGGFFNTTVLGAMERKKKSGESARAELHMDHALGSDRMSGVVGLGRRYKLLSGLTLSMNYERFQVLSGGPALSSPQPVTGQAAERGSAGRVVGTSDLVGQPSAPNLGSPLLQSGMNAWGLAPVSGSRDALGFSLRYKKHRKLMITARSELRLELASEAKLEDVTQQDRLIQFHEISARLRLNSDLTMLGRFALAEVKNLTAIKREHLANEVSVGLALRPQHTDRYRGLLRYSRRQDLRADQRWLTKDLLAFEPIFRTPWYLQIAPKFALKADAESDELLGSATAMTGLFVSRFDLELSKLLRRQKSLPIPGDFELWTEYRLLADLTVGAAQNGFALGLSYLPIKHLRIGMGYSFSAVPDTLTTSETIDGSGFFMRVSGVY